MPRIYENAKANFTNFDHFKEVAVKSLNEIYGRVKPLDVFDFSYTETTYKALGYYDHEFIPEAQPEGAPMSVEAAAAERSARENEELNKTFALEEAASHELRIKAAIAAGETLTPEDQIIAKNLNIDFPVQDAFKELSEADAAELVDKVKTGRMSYEAAHAFGLKEIDGVPVLEAAKNALQNAAAPTPEVPTKNLPYNVKQVGDKLISDKALTLAVESGVDISQIEGTGRDGTIKVDDVKDYIANNAPAQENADGNDEQQSNS